MVSAWKQCKGEKEGSERSGCREEREEGWIALFNGVVWVDLSEKVTCDQDLRKMRECEGKAFQAEGTAGAKALGREPVWHAGGTPCVLQNQCQKPSEDDARSFSDENNDLPYFALDF